MNSRERVLAAINHRQPDRIPIDLGSTLQSGINASSLYQLRKYLGLPEKDVHIYNVSQMLGTLDDDIRQILKPDIIGLFNPMDSSGVYDNGKKQRFILPDGTPTLVNAGLAYDTLPNGGVHLYPQGDRSAKPSLYMTPGGLYFNYIDRAEPYDEDNLTPREDFKNLFFTMTDETARYYEEESKRLFTETDYAIIGNLSGAGFGEPPVYAGGHEKNPKGIRSYEDWTMAQIMYPDYVLEVYELQTEYMLKNLEIYRQAVGDNIQIVHISSKDFGAQNSEIMSATMFKELYKPYYTRICKWVHDNTNWKTFFHTCGCVTRLLDDFVEMGMDIFNPVQISPAMDAHMLKEKYGDKLVFWGGGIDTQETLPFGTPEEIAAEVEQRIDILSKDGGYIFNAVHNIVGDIPSENIWATYKAAQDYNTKHFG